MLPIGMFIYAWSSFVFVPWIALTIGITLFIWATFIMYLAAFSYLADWCEVHLSILQVFFIFIKHANFLLTSPVMGHMHHLL